MDPRASEIERLDIIEVPEDEDGEIEVTRIEIEQTRAEMTDTLEAIKEKLNPQTLMEQAKETVREATIGRAQDAVGHAVDSVKGTVSDAADSAREAMSSAGEATRGAGQMIIQTIKENPMPAALTGLGLAWLWMSARQQSAAPRTDERRYDADFGYTDRPAAELYRQNWTPYQNQDQGFVDQAKDRASRVVGQVQGQISDVGSQVQDKVSELGSQVQDKVSQLGSQVQEKASQIGSQVQEKASYLGSQAQYQARQVTDQFGRMLQDNPMALGAVAMALGAGMAFALPTTPQEKRLMGEARDQLVDRAQDMVQDVAHKAQSVVQEAVGTVKEEARNQGLTA